MLIVDQLRKNELPLRVLAWVVATGFLVLFAGLYYVQVVSADRFREEQKNQSFRSVRLPAMRGKILDRNGELLAGNRPSYQISVYLEDRAVRDRFKEQYRRAKGNRRLTREQQNQLGRQTRYQVASNLAARVSEVLRRPVPLSEPQFTRHYERSLALPLPLLSDVGPEEVARFAESSSLPPGVDLEIRSIRSYPHRSAAGHVLGYLTRDEGSADDDDISFNYRLPDFIGITGIEAIYNDDLKGRPGGMSVLVNNLGYRQSENVWQPVSPGANVTLTLDLALQREAENALSRALNNTRGAAVVVDVRNGDVLALASAPGYDPGAFVPFVPLGVWTNLNDEKLRPLINRAVHGSYPPGSIFKVLVGLAGLEAGTLDPTNVFMSPGYAQVGPHHMKDTADGGRPGPYDFRRALKLSCNAYFVKTGLDLGLDRIVAMARRFHFGERTGIDLRPEAPGILPTREYIRDNRGAWFDGDTANLSIGQGDITVTPLQVALMTAAVANGGTVFWPRLVQRVQGEDAFAPEPARTVAAGRVRSRTGVSARSLQITREAMLADVEDADGTGRHAALPGFRIAAKTGTAEVKKGRAVVDKITWFTSFGPYESPRYAVVVMIESGGGGGTTCGPVARRIYEAILEREKANSLAVPRSVAMR